MAMQLERQSRLSPTEIIFQEVQSLVERRRHRTGSTKHSLRFENYTLRFENYMVQSILL